MESGLCLNLASYFIWGSSYIFFLTWSENTVFNQDVMHPLKNNIQIPCDRRSATPNRALCSTQKQKHKELLQP